MTILPIFRGALIVAPLVAALATALPAQAQRRFAPSGRGTSEIVLMMPEGDTTKPAAVRLDYGQPHLRGRTMHTDSLVPYGQIWRTGANATSTLSTDLDLVIGGTRIPRGRYAVFTLPARDGWKLVLQRDTGQGAGDYASQNDVARIDLRRRDLATPVESLSMWLIPAMSGLAGELRISWGTTELSVPFSATR